MEIKINIDESKFQEVLEKELGAFTQEELHSIMRDAIKEYLNKEEVLVKLINQQETDRWGSIVRGTSTLEKFVNNVVPGGIIIMDSSTIDVEVERKDIKVFKVPATAIADENGLKGLANIILVGKLFKETGFVSEENLDLGLQKCIPPKKAAMLDTNRKALEIGRNQ